MPIRAGARPIAQVRVRAAASRSRDGASTATGRGRQGRADAQRRRAARPIPGTLRFFPFAEGKIEAGRARRSQRATAPATNADAARREAARRRIHAASRVCSRRAMASARQRAATIDVPLHGHGRRRGLRPTASPAAQVVAGASRASGGPALPLVRRAGLRVRRRRAAQPDAVRVSGAVAQGARLRRAPRQSRARCACTDSHSRRASSCRSGCSLPVLVALRAAGQQLGWGFQLQSPAVVAALAILFFVLALNLVRRVRGAPAAAVATGELERQESLRERCAVRRARGRHRVAVLRAVHGRRARLRADRIGAGHVADVHRARRRHGAAVRAARVLPGVAREAAQARPMDGALAAAARVSAVRDGGLAGLGARCATRQRCGRPSRRVAGADRARAVVVAGAAPRQSAWRAACAIAAIAARS